MVKLLNTFQRSKNSIGYICCCSIVLMCYNVECMSSGTYTDPFNYATNFNVPLLIHIVVCSSGLKQTKL